MVKRKAKPADIDSFKQFEIGSVDELVKQFMELRAEGFWSFRGEKGDIESAGQNRHGVADERAV